MKHQRENESILKPSHQTAMRDASEALIEAIKKAEEVHLNSAKNDSKNSKTIIPKGNQKKGGKPGTESTGFEFEKDEVCEKSLVNSTEHLNEEILGTFATLDDANYFVRNRCADIAERDDPDAIFDEAISPDGRISWNYEDESGYGTEVRIEKCTITVPGSVSTRDWGRPIGEPCPEKEDSKEDSSEEDDEFRQYEKEIEFEPFDTGTESPASHF